jgi:GT2 family glycosyltransferase
MSKQARADAAAPHPSASIVVLGWNGLEYVDGCLSSVLDQDFERPFEVLFVDNGSTDGTPERVASYAVVALHRLDRNYGYCEGNNIGYSRASGDYVVFLNQDVVVHRSWLRELVAAVESSPAIRAAHANIIQPWYPEFSAMERVGAVAAAYTADLSPLGLVHYRKLSGAAPAIDTMFLHGVSIIVKRELIDELGYVFDPDMFAYAEDLDLALRTRALGYRTIVATRATVYHKHTLDARPSLGSFIKTVRIIRNRLLALWKCSTWPEFTPLAIVTLIGAPLNAGEFGLPAWRRIAYFFMLIPPTLVAGVAALAAMPSYAGRRRAVLKTRRVGRWWFLRTVLSSRRAGLGPPARVIAPTDGA